MSSLTGSTISSTYQSLLKIDGNNTLSATLRNITDGVGNITPLSMSTTLLNISTAFKLSSYGTGTRTGTATYNLAVDATGNVIEVLGGGGTTINPNDNVIPVRLDSTTFVDSNIENYVNNYLKTSVTPTSGDYFGLKIDFVNFDSILGDFDGFNNGIKLAVSNSNEFIKTSYQGADKGLFFDFANQIYQLGDFNSVSSGASFYIDEANSTIYTQHSGQQEGLFFDFVNDYFSIGDFGNTNNGTYLKIDDDNQQITFKANNKLVFKGTNLLDANTYTYSDKNLVIEAPDGNTYYIPLYS